MINKSIVLEDSSQRSLGGGQKITLLLINHLLKSNSKINVFDICSSSDFQKLLPSNVSRNNYFKARNIIPQINQLYFIYLLRKVRKFIGPLLWTIRALKFSFICKEKSIKNIIACTKKTYLILLISQLFTIKNNNQNLIIYHHMAYQNNLIEAVFFNLITLLQKCVEIKEDNENKILHLFVSEYTKSSFSAFNKICKQNAIVIYNPTPDEDELKKLRESYTNLLYSSTRKIVICSSLIPFKGVLEFLQDFELYSYENLNSYELHIYGYGELSEKIKIRCKSIPKAYFHGKVNNPKTALKEASVVLIPSIQPEACPLVAIESMCAGRPCFSLPLGGQNELLSHTNILINNSSNINILKSIHNFNTPSLIKISTNSSTIYDKTLSLSKYCKSLDNIF